MNGKMTRVRYLHPEEMNEVLAQHDDAIVSFDDPDYNKINHFKQTMYIYEGMVEFRVSCWDKVDKKVTTYICFKDGRETIPSISGAVAYQTLCKYYKVEDLLKGIDDQTLIRNIFPSASPLIGFNEEYSGTRQQAWGYDLNSAYSKALTSMWIDTSERPDIKEIEEGKEIGFKLQEAPNGEYIWHIQRKGFSKMVFPITEVPEGIKRFVDVWYNRKKTAANKEEKKKAKDMLNMCIGYLQRKNPYLRLMVVCLCNEYIESLIDENTLFYNTDSIVSRVRRPDLEANLGKNVGQWKIEHEGVVAYKGNTYQWNNDVPTWRGIPKSWFPEDYDLLRDGMPINRNIWKFNEDTLRLEVNYGDIR